MDFKQLLHDKKAQAAAAAIGGIALVAYFVRKNGGSSASGTTASTGTSTAGDGSYGGLGGYSTGGGFSGGSTGNLDPNAYSTPSPGVYGLLAPSPVPGAPSTFGLGPTDTMMPGAGSGQFGNFDLGGGAPADGGAPAGSGDLQSASNAAAVAALASQTNGLTNTLAGLQHSMLSELAAIGKIKAAKPATPVSAHKPTVKAAPKPAAKPVIKHPVIKHPAGPSKAVTTGVQNKLKVMGL